MEKSKMKFTCHEGLDLGELGLPNSDLILKLLELLIGLVSIDLGLGRELAQCLGLVLLADQFLGESLEFLPVFLLKLSKLGLQLGHLVLLFLQSDLVLILLLLILG